MSEELSVVGRRLPRPDAALKATGAAQFTADIRLPGMLVGKVLRSPYPHARIVRIDTSAAEKLPGVAAVLTRDDVPEKSFTVFTFDLFTPWPFRPELKDQHVLSEKARFIGDPVAAVAAVDEATAETALALIKVDYEPIKPLISVSEATKEGSPRIHDHAERNAADRSIYAFPVGNVEKAMQEADHIVEQTFSTTRQRHGQLEPTTCIAHFGSDGRLTVWSACQTMHAAKRKIAELFDLPPGMVRWITPHIGGNFGQKLSLTAEPICIALAKKTGRPVKLQYSREEDFIATESRQPFVMTGKMGVRKDGTIAALHARGVLDAGAYFTQSRASATVGLGKFFGLYRCAHMAGEAEIVYTNTPVCGGMRGYGDAEMMFVLEQLVDMAAEKLGMDPVDFRLQNIRRAGEPSDPPYILIEHSALDKCIKRGAQMIGWREKRVLPKQGVVRRGIGMACNTHVSGAQSGLLEFSTAFVKLNADGSATVTVSPCEMGQGILGVLAQIAAEELGLRIENVNMVTGDTDVTGFDVGSHASRSTYVTGGAVVQAARQVKGQLLEGAAKALGVAADTLAVRDGRVYVRDAPEKGISVAEVTRNVTYNFKGENLNIAGKAANLPQKSPPFQAAFAEVEVDTETGQVKVLKVLVVADIGRAINPMTVEGQFQGGIMQGIGFALLEDFIFDPASGLVITDNFDGYRLPTVGDVPDIEVALVEEPVASGPFGAKGLGELSIIGIAPAIANAIYNAIGVRLTELPMTPERVLNALSGKGKG
ncbi:MAG: molybdopterin-dependent oxidoreductase [Chloroflexi bacterium]|nr:molybdopterin-dependent oxidoreductase [Chloroflexota bacterium]